MISSKTILSLASTAVFSLASAHGATLLFSYAANDVSSTLDANRYTNHGEVGTYTVSAPAEAGMSASGGWSTGNTTTSGYVYWRSFTNVTPNTATPTSTGASSLTFNMTADAGTTLSLETFSFNLATRFDAANTAYAQAYISTDGGANYTAIGSVFSKVQSGTTNTATAPTLASIDLSSYTGLSNVSIRVSLGDTTATVNPSSVLVGDLKLTGTAVPEPTTSLLGGLGTLLLVMRRRR